MRVRLAPSSFGAAGTAGPDQFLVTYLIDDRLAVDAGSLGLQGPASEQAKFRDVLLTHSHIDHIASLPLFLENVYDGKPDCVTVHASAATLDTLQRDMFNDRVWPDFIGMSSPATPFLRTRELVAGSTVQVSGYHVTPIEVAHVVPTLGYVIDDGHAAIALSSDTGPTDELWHVARQVPHLKAVFLEASFPNRMEGLAEVSQHLTPEMFAAEVAKLGRPDVRLLAMHVKSRFRGEIEAELRSLGLAGVEPMQAGHVYEF